MHHGKARALMTALGHQRRFGHVPTMSGLPLTADIVASVGTVAKGQKPTQRRCAKPTNSPRNDGG
jgi:enterochelin esterase-like enzyme